MSIEFPVVLTWASMFFAILAAYQFIRQMIIERSFLLKCFPGKTLRFAGIGLILSFIAQTLKMF